MHHRQKVSSYNCCTVAWTAFVSLPPEDVFLEEARSWRARYLMLPEAPNKWRLSVAALKWCGYLWFVERSWWKHARVWMFFCFCGEVFGECFVCLIVMSNDQKRGFYISLFSIVVILHKPLLKFCPLHSFNGRLLQSSSLIIIHTHTTHKHGTKLMAGGFFLWLSFW